MKPGPSFLPSPRSRGRLLAFVLLGLSVTGLANPREARAEKTLGERILEKKYRRGDYAFYVGWYDPWGAQFDEHGKFAFPFGGKVRLRLSGILRAEGDFSYYRRGGEPNPFVTIFATPEFDGVVLSFTVQAMLLRDGWFRPYLGAGPVFVSLSNDFIVDRPDIPDDLPENLEFATWKELDVGLQTVLGVDLLAGQRFFPFLEYRQLFGEVTIDEVNIGLIPFDPVKDLEISDTYDWSGPNIMGGLKIRF